MNAVVGDSLRVSALRAGICTGVLAAVLLMSASASWAQTDKTAAPPAGTPSAKTGAPATSPATPKQGAEGSTKGSDKSQQSYSVGVSMGAQLKSMGITSDALSIERLTQGLRDAMAGKATLTPEQQQNIQNFIRTARNTQAQTQHAAAEKFLAENGKKKDVVTTASGLEYRVVTPGEGAPPKSTDQVTVNYRGTLLDGSEFDSSYKRGQPASFPVNGVIPGWQEALVLMKPGAKWEVYVPPKLAYDMAPPTPAIPPGALLKFDIELIKVQPPAAAAPPPAKMPPPKN
jgi:FKBP-type peptidyl-prolyl cis-trans isomerase FkpA